MLTRIQFINIWNQLVSRGDISHEDYNSIRFSAYNDAFPFKDDLVVLAPHFGNIGFTGSDNAYKAIHTLLNVFAYEPFNYSQFKTAVEKCSLPVAFALMSNNYLPIEFLYSFKSYEKLNSNVFVYDKEYHAKAFKEKFDNVRKRRKPEIIDSAKKKLVKLENANIDALTDDMILKICGIDNIKL